MKENTVPMTAFIPEMTKENFKYYVFILNKCLNYGQILIVGSVSQQLQLNSYEIYQLLLVLLTRLSSRKG